MILAFILFQCIILTIAIFELPNSIVIALYFALVVCLLIANARWEAVWSEIDELKMEIEKLQKNKK